MHVTYVYAGLRSQQLLEAIDRCEAPDTPLFGYNHLSTFGISTTMHHSIIRRRELSSACLDRMSWKLREAVLPWELMQTDVVCTSLGTLFPLLNRLKRGPKVLLLNMDLGAKLARLSPVRRRVLLASVQSTAGIVCFSAAQRARLIDQTGLPPARVFTALFGVDTTFYAPSGATAEGYVLAVGRDVARDYQTLAEGVRNLDCRVVIVTSKRNLAGVVLPPNVEIRLDISYQELRSLYDRAACVVISTRREEYALGAECSGQTVLLEAMAMGRPVVASARSSLFDYVEPGRTALVVPPEDPPATREAIERILQDNTAANIMGENARKQVQENFDSSKFAQQIARILYSVNEN